MHSVLTMRALVLAALLFSLLTPREASAQFNGCAPGFCGPYAGATFVPSCSASATWLASVTGQSPTEVAADDAMICGMIADGNGCSAWSGSSGHASAIWILATNSTATAYKNMCPGGSTITVGAGSPTFTADLGVTGDASASYLNTNYNPGSGNDTQNSNSWGLCITNNRSTGLDVTDVNSITGAPVNENVLLPRTTGLATYAENWGYAFPNYTAPATINGMWVNSRTGSAGFTVYVNSVSLFAPTSASIANSAPLFSFILLAQYNSIVGPTYFRWSGDTIAAFYIDAGENSTVVGQMSSRIGTRVHATSGNSSCS